WVVSRTMNKGAQMRAPINQKLIETGERERLKELLRAKLIECGWKDQLKAHPAGNFPYSIRELKCSSTGVLMAGRA
uniref:ENY2 transcription and export complex 2 subunit n=1 Tax=Nomascus leucogenys TaxID=61853 RepID=A0A2I3GEA4_NOMLE